MLDILKAIIFGIVEGITEWLPISSTGHLIIMEELLKLDQGDAFFEMFQVVIQLGAILAVIVIYFHKLNPFSPKKTQKQKMMTWQIWIWKRRPQTVHRSRRRKYGRPRTGWPACADKSGRQEAADAYRDKNRNGKPEILPWAEPPASRVLCAAFAQPGGAPKESTATKNATD